MLIWDFFVLSTRLATGQFPQIGRGKVKRKGAAEYKIVKGKMRRQMSTMVLSFLSKQALMVGTASILKNTLACFSV